MKPYSNLRLTGLVAFGVALAALACGSDGPPRDNNRNTVPDADITPPAAPDAAPASLVINLRTMDYGQVVVGNESAPFTFAITNVGGSPSGVITAVVGGPSGREFPLASGGCPESLRAGQSCTLSVGFRPTSPGVKSATLTVSSPFGGNLSATLSGSGLAPGALSVTPTFVDFGMVAIGAESVDAEFTIRNDGEVATGLLSTNILAMAGASAAPFFLTFSTCGNALPATATCTVRVKFRPSTAGSHLASLQIEGVPGGKVVSSLVGTGQMSPKEARLSVDATAKEIAPIAVGENGAAYFDISNTGETPTGRPSIQLFGSNAQEFSVSANGCTEPLKTNDICTIHIVFQPMTKGMKSASLRVSATPGGSVVATVAATALGEAEFTANPFFHDFGGILQGSGQYRDYDFTIKNTGGKASGVLGADLQLLGELNFQILGSPNDCRGRPLLVDASCSVRVRFQPVSAGTKTATLSVSATPGMTAMVSLTGRAIQGPEVINGLNYRYFEGTWDALPDFDRLTAVKSGTADSFSLSVRNRNDNFGLQTFGLIRIDTAGSYTFFTNSDEGSRLYVDGRLIVDNDGIHTARERSGTVSLSAGFHPIKVVSFERTGVELLEVRYQGPDISKRIISNSVLFRPSTLNPGINYSYYEGTWDLLPNFDSLVATKGGAKKVFEVSGSDTPDNFGFVLEGQVFAPQTGTYTLFTTSDDGSQLYVDGALVVDNDGVHTARERAGVITLTEGFHPIKATYFDKAGVELLEVRIEGPGVSKTLLGTEFLYKQ